MTLALKITPDGGLLTAPADDLAAMPLPLTVEDRLVAAFAHGTAAGLLHLAAEELQTLLPPDFAFCREFAGDYLTRLCHTPGLDNQQSPPPVDAPDDDALATRAMRAPPMQGLEYLNVDLLQRWWRDLDALVRGQIAAFPGGTAAYLREKNPLWRLVGRVTFHLAENKRDPDNPFAFLATYATRAADQAKLRQLPLGEALKEYAGAGDRQRLVSLLTPIQRAAEQSSLARELTDSGDIYHPVAWSPSTAYRFLQDVPIFEQSGLIVRVPNWWNPTRPSRAVVSVRIGNQTKVRLDTEALLDFSVGVTVDGQSLNEIELKTIMEASKGLILLKGKWVEVDGEKLSEALEQWRRAQRESGGDGVSFLEGMRMLAGVGMGDAGVAAAVPAATRAWSDVVPGEWLAARLTELRDSQNAADGDAPDGLVATLRPYQSVGVHWLTFMSRLGLGACLADDMGLGKTIQVLGLLLRLKASAAGAKRPPSLLIVPASLIANWKDELARFAPSLRACVAHPSEGRPALLESDVDAVDRELSGMDLVITTYTMATRLDWLPERTWNAVILDEAQAIKNSGTKQTRRVKQLRGAARIAMTGTPVENRLSDLWSIFDFINPGLLGAGRTFARYVKAAADTPGGFAPLRELVRPYILRRLKTDKRIIADLPDKTEVRAFCALSAQQIALYQQAIGELSAGLNDAEGIQRKGLVLAYLMKFKQICNHPSQLLNDAAYDPSHSGKFERLRELCEVIASRQEKVLVFTQFREITAPLAAFLRTIFQRDGLVLHGGTPVGERQSLVARFQDANGPPFFVLSLKAGGVGLNLTAASHVIHFDRWWNPAVENQATDRAFRIGQKKNVLVHKFVCRGTMEEKIDAMIEEKIMISKDILEGGADKMLTEMNDKELLRLVSLDIGRAGGL